MENQEEAWPDIGKNTHINDYFDLGKYFLENLKKCSDPTAYDKVVLTSMMLCDTRVYRKIGFNIPEDDNAPKQNFPEGTPDACLHKQFPYMGDLDNVNVQFTFFSKPQ